MAGELERRIARLQPGDHLCLIYGSPAERWATLIPFFRQALAAGARTTKLSCWTGTGFIVVADGLRYGP